MRILHVSPEALVLRQRPWGIPLLCAIMAVGNGANLARLTTGSSLAERIAVPLVVLVCVVMIWISAERVQLTFDRRADEFRWHRRFGLGIRDRDGRTTLANVRRARVVEHDSGDGKTWRVVLDIENEIVNLTDIVAGSDQRNHELANTINTWLTEPPAIATQRTASAVHV
jgi:hypothetical protein